MNGQIFMYEITRYLAWFTSQIKLENNGGNFDINKYSEGFLVPILNSVFKKNFKRAEYFKVNFPAVDLISEDGNIGIQVTAERGFNKIKETIEKYITHGLYKAMKLHILVLDEDYQTRKSDEEIQAFIEELLTAQGTNPKPSITFVKSEQFWNIGILRRKIEENCGIANLKVIRDFLHEQYGEVTSLPTFDDILIPYEVAFDAEINPKSSNLPFQFSNSFFGRDKELEKLQKFAESDQKMISIVAEGGYGKTRLSLEAFKLFKKKGLDTFVLNERYFKTLQFSEDLRTEKTVIILIDDAHKRKLILNDIVEIASRIENVKLILTIRTATYDDTMEALPSHKRQIESIPLPRLSNDLTKALIKSQLPGLETNQLQAVAERSKGVPIVILTLCQLIRSGKYSTAISEEDNFVQFVREVKKQVISDIADKYYLETKTINRTIELLSIFSPLKNDEKELRLFAEINEVSFEETSTILDHLQEYDFIQKRREIFIRPDPYSDVILLDAESRIRHILQHQKINPFVDRIIRNVSQVDNSERLKFNINQLIDDFIEEMSTNTLNDAIEIANLKTNLDTVAHFAYKRPKTVSRVFEVILLIADGKQDFWGHGEGNWNFSPFKEIQDRIDTIFSIVALNTHRIPDLRYLLSLILKYVAARKDYRLLRKSFGYRVFDFNEYSYLPPIVCERQQFLLSELKRINTKDELADDDISFLFEGCGILLVLEFSIEESFDKYTHSFTFGHAHVPYSEVTLTIRIEALKILISLYKRIRESRSAKDLYDKLIRTLYFIIKKTDNKFQFNQSAEIELVGSFLMELMTSGPAMLERVELNKYLKIFSRREVKTEYLGLRKSLLEATGNLKSNIERLEFLLSEEYFYAKEKFVPEMEQLVNAYSDHEIFFKDIVIVRQKLKGMESQYTDVLSFFNEYHPDLSRELFAYVIKHHQELTVDFSDLIRVDSKNEKEFYEKIDLLWQFNTEEAKASVIFLITYGRGRDINLYRPKDLIYVETVVKEKNAQAVWRLTVALPDFMLMDSRRTLRLIDEILHFEDHRDKGLLIHSLFEKESIVKEFKNELKEFVFESTMDIIINSYYYDALYRFLEQEFGFETLFDYLKKRIQIDIDKKDFYRLDFSHSYQNTHKPIIEKESDFINVLKWYVSLNDSVPRLYDKIVEFFRPEPIMSVALASRIEELALTMDEVKSLERLGNALNVFINKNKEFVRLLIKMGNQAVKMKGYNEDIMGSIIGDLSNVGAKSKSGNGPFPQDVERKELILSVMDLQMEHDVRAQIELSLKWIEDVIRREEDSELRDQW